MTARVLEEGEESSLHTEEEQEDDQGDDDEEDDEETDLTPRGKGTGRTIVTKSDVHTYADP